MKRHLLAVIGIMLALMCWPAGRASADASPPQNPPGGAVGAGGYDTHVQMVAEDVLITVEGVPEGTGQGKWHYLTASTMRAHVEASFEMVNQGDEQEAFDVWFPLGASDGYSENQTVDQFAAWVGDTPAPTDTITIKPENWYDPAVWATWPVTFPPSERVTLRVAYDAYPTGYNPFGAVEYLLQTGAGWWGPIGQGKVTLRLPYDVDRFNTAMVEPHRPYPDYYEVSGNEIVWTFTDLEPTRDDNVEVTLLSPLVWEAIVETEAKAAASPDSPQAHLDLARSRVAALEFKYGLVPIGNSVEMAGLAAQAYQQVLALDPDNLDIIDEYLEFVDMLLWYPDTYGEDSAFCKTVVPEGLLPILDHALERDPFNPQLNGLRDRISPCFPDESQPPTPTPSITSTATPMTPTPLPTHDQAVASVPTLPAAAAAPTEPRALAPTPLPAVTDTPPGRLGLPVLVAAAILIAAAIVILLVARRQRDQTR